MSYYGNGPPPNQQYGAPPPAQRPPPQQQYGGPPSQQYGAPSPQQQQYGAPPQQQQFNQNQQTHQQYGQYQQQPPPQYYGAPPPQQYPGLAGPADPAATFRAVDVDNSGCLNPEELKRALNNADGSQYEAETVKLMISMFDRDNSGTIAFNEFISLFKYLNEWKNVFEKFDADRSGTIDRNELSSALRGFGFNVSDRIVELMIRKYAKRGMRSLDS